jgi:capsular polysaccharide biosynthesis protein
VRRLPGIARGSNGARHPSDSPAVNQATEGTEASRQPPPPEGASAWAEAGDSRPGVASAIRNNWVAFLLPIVILVSAAVVAGLLRSPTYTAETRLAVGGLDASSPASNSDFAAATASLAQTYGRSIQGDEVATAVARATGTSPEYVRAHVSAFTVPSTPLFSVEATASSPQAAIALANLASEALSQAADKATQDIVSPLLRRYRRAEIDQQRVERNVRYLEATGQDGDLVAAQADLAIAETRAASTREAFVAGQQRQQSLAVPIQVIERANAAASDRVGVLELWIFVGLVLGVILGTALAMFRESRILRYMGS